MKISRDIGVSESIKPSSGCKRHLSTPPRPRPDSLRTDRTPGRARQGTASGPHHPVLHRPVQSSFASRLGLTHGSGSDPPPAGKLQRGPPRSPAGSQLPCNGKSPCDRVLYGVLPLALTTPPLLIPCHQISTTAPRPFPTQPGRDHALALSLAARPPRPPASRPGPHRNATLEPCPRREARKTAAGGAGRRRIGQPPRPCSGSRAGPIRPLRGRWTSSALLLDVRDRYQS